MKVSKIAWFYIFLGITIFVICAILSVIENERVSGLVLLTFGISLMSLLWIMALQIDVYEIMGKKEKECLKSSC